MLVSGPFSAMQKGEKSDRYKDDIERKWRYITENNLVLLNNVLNAISNCFQLTPVLVNTFNTGEADRFQEVVD